MLPLLQYLVLLLLALSSIVTGLVGLILPFLPGFLLIVAGLVLLSLLDTRVEAWLHRITEKHPPTHKMVAEVRTFISRIIGKK